MAAPAVTFEALRTALRAGKVPAAVTVLHGEEGYYTDALVDLFEGLVPEQDRDFGLTVVYAPQIEPQAVVDIARRLPMMAERQVVIVKEAQAVGAAWMDKLARYVAAPSPSTVFVVAARGEVIKGKEFLKAVKAANGVVFESRRVFESQLPRVLEAYIRQQGLTADQQALSMLCDYIGSDLSRLYNEVDKLVQILGPRACITPESVERNVGVSREFNNFELVDAIAAKDIARMFRIASSFEANPKANPLTVSVSTIFNFFMDLLVAVYSKDKTDAGLTAELALNPRSATFALRRFRTAMSKYNAFQIIEILDALRTFDAMSKGSGSRQDPYRLFHDLMFHIASAPGRLPC